MCTDSIAGYGMTLVREGQNSLLVDVVGGSDLQVGKEGHLEQLSHPQQQSLDPVRKVSKDARVDPNANWVLTRGSASVT